MAQAGIPPADILAMSTRDAAVELGLQQDSGTLEDGKRADLVVLRADPLRDIRNTRRIEYVLAQGHLYEPAALMASAGLPSGR